MRASTAPAPVALIVFVSLALLVEGQLQGDIQATVFDLEGAWKAVLARSPSPGIANPAGGLGPRASNFSLTAAKIYTVTVPAGNWTLQGNINVSAGQLLVLQGTGGLLEPGSQQTPTAKWVFDAARPNAASIHIMPGAGVYVRNMTLAAPTLGSPVDSPTAFVPTAFTLPDNNTYAGAFILEFSAVILSSCSSLQDMQNLMCQMMTEDSNTPWPTAEMEPGWAFVYLMQGYKSNVTVNGVLFACSWTLPAFQPLEVLSVAPSHGPAEAPVQNNPLYNHTLLELDESGLPSKSWLTVGPGLVPADMADSNSTAVQCVARRVLNSQQLLRAVVELQAVSSRYVVIQVVRNISMSPSSDAYVWPRENTALWIYRNVTIIGRHALVTHVTEIDFALLRNLFWLGNSTTAMLRLQQLDLVNMPCGPRAWFPASLLVVHAWPVAWDRSRTDRIYLEIKNSTITLPEDNFSYTTYWVGIQASPVPSVRALGSWQTNLQFQGALEISNDSHTLFLQRRWGQGIQWTNTSLTDIAVLSPLARINCGLQSLVPGNNTYPYTYITPVFSAEGLAAYLKAPGTPTAMLANNISVDVAAVRRVGGVTINSGVQVLGWWEGASVMDLHNAADLFNVQVPDDQQVVLGRLYLTGLGAATSDQQPQQLANWTCMLWAWNFARSSNPYLYLQNATLFLPADEVTQLKAFSDGSSAIQQTPALATPPLLKLASDWNSGRESQGAARQDAISMTQVVYSSVSAKGLVASSSLPDNLATLTTVHVPPTGLSLGPDAAMRGAASQTGDSGNPSLTSWQIALIAVGCVLVVGIALACCWAVRAYRHHRRHQQASSIKGDGATPRGSSCENSMRPSSPHPALNEVLVLFGGSADTSHGRSSTAGPGTGMRSPATYTPALTGSRTSLHTRGGSKASSPAASLRLAANKLVVQPPFSEQQVLGGVQYGFMEVSPSSVGAQASAGTDPTDPTDPTEQADSALPDGDVSKPGHRRVRSKSVPWPAAAPVAPVAAAALSLGASRPHQLGTRPSAPARFAPQFIRGSHDDVVMAAAAGPAQFSLGPSLAHQGGQHQGAQQQGLQQTTNLNTVQGAQQQGLQQTTNTVQDSYVAALQGRGLLIVGSSSNTTGLGQETAQPPPQQQEVHGSGGGADVRAGGLLDQGLAAGVEGSAPELLLQQVIAHRKEMQGIDMQQITFQDVLGQGNFGVVYKGKWRSLTVAIKTLMFQDASEAKRIRQRAITEAAINSVLTHDNIVNTFAHDLRPVVGGGMPDEQHAACWKLYIIQEYCDGGSLAQAVDRGLFMDPRSKLPSMLPILKVAEDIARGMTYIHENNVIHGDLSSGNVLLRNDSQNSASRLQAKVGDFGLSRFLEGPGHSHISNVRQGTPFYIAPEVLNRGVISKPADVFSFGVLLWEMFCGTPPWRDPALKAFQDTLNPMTFPYHVPRSCPIEYHELVMDCLTENPKDRPRFPELLQRISQLLSLISSPGSDTT